MYRRRQRLRPRESLRDRMSFLPSVPMHWGHAVHASYAPFSLSLPLWQSRMRRPVMRLLPPSSTPTATVIGPLGCVTTWGPVPGVSGPPGIVSCPTRPEAGRSREGLHTFHHRIWQAKRPTRQRLRERERERERERMILPPPSLALPSVSHHFLEIAAAARARKHAPTHAARAARPSRCGALISFFRPFLRCRNRETQRHRRRRG